MSDIETRIEAIIRENYVEDFSLESAESKNYKVDDVIIDSITLLEFFMILEEEFKVDYKISSEIDLTKLRKSTIKDAIKQIASTISS
jgi:acyl carrier protein